ncbi:serine protease [Leptospira yasudae]|uniref:Serine protease n=2 Tax=Leptospira yasudae TaxID=2202201 RepID=A0A6N4QIC5_9LEPT|nr:trypsin-like peptidase domain-containing protein [Leptospira yasudae]TGL79138.1 serine protease [Leptospira yasudae]TGL83114.1 serine protease [Leptospira yasudae]TGL85655.1 serine protease [Leptospira yasudae]
MDSFRKGESNEKKSSMKHIFSILKLLSLLVVLGVTLDFCSSSAATQVQTQTQTSNGSEDPERELEREFDDLPADGKTSKHTKDGIRVHHIFEEVYPTSSASSVSIFTEKTVKSSAIHHKGGHLSEKILVMLGSGIIYNKQGYILTNAHVIKSHDHLVVRVKSGKSYEAIVIGQDKRIDLAILQVTPDEDIVPVEKLDYYTHQRGEAAIQKYINAKIQIRKNREAAKNKNRTSA